jgi:cbb3-type cytochrome c oxidase subunit III
LRAAPALSLVAALLVAGCGTGGISKGGDQAAGKELFLKGANGKPSCASCHTLKAAGANGVIGPNLDDAFADGRKQGMKQDTIEQVVLDQIRLAACVDPSNPRLCMPQDLLTGEDADAVAAYVAQVAGNPSAVSSGGGKQPTSGKDIFLANCGSCHTLASAGTSGTIGPNLDQLMPNMSRVQRQVINGGTVMPAFKGKLTPAQITAVAKYVSRATKSGSR